MPTDRVIVAPTRGGAAIAIGTIIRDSVRCGREPVTICDVRDVDDEWPGLMTSQG